MSVDAPRVMAALKRGGGFIRSQVGKRMQLRHAPEIRFKLDDSIERGIRIHKILKEVLPADKTATDDDDEASS